MATTSLWHIEGRLKDLIDYVENLRFSEEDIGYLRSKGLFSEEFLDYLRHFQFTGYALFFGV